MSINRRSLLKSFSAGLAGLGIARAIDSHAMEPIQHLSGPSMKLSIAAYSFRDDLKADPPKMTLLDGFIQFAAEQGLDAIEPTSYYFPKPVTAEYVLELKRRAILQGLAISGTAIRNVYTHAPGEEREEELKNTREWVDFAALLAAPAIRVFAGNKQGDDSLETAQRHCIDTLEEACSYAATKGVFLALENHGGIVDTAANMMPIIKAVKSPWFGVNLDTGNFTSEDPYADIALMAPYAVNVQVKVEINPGGRGKQPADLPRIFKILKDSGYRGYVALEYEAKEETMAAVPRHLKTMRELMRQ